MNLIVCVEGIKYSIWRCTVMPIATVLRQMTQLWCVRPIQQMSQLYRLNTILIQLNLHVNVVSVSMGNFCTGSFSHW